MKRARTWGYTVALLACATACLWGVQQAVAIPVAMNIDVHQDVPGEPFPNDYHIEGLICSHGSVAPMLVTHIDGPFTAPNGTFSYSIAPAGLPDPCWYKFTADWALVPPASLMGIPFCTPLHLGLLFEVDSQNVMIDMHGWWTRDGQPIGEIQPNLPNGGFSPIVGFNVTEDDPALGRFIRIANGNIIEPPQSAQPAIPIEIVQMDLVSFPPEQSPQLEDLMLGGAQETWPWVPVKKGDGSVISPTNPLPVPPDSFFDVFFDIEVPGQPSPITPIPLEPGGFLVARTKMAVINNAGQREERWQWEFHGEPLPPQACCLPDGTCAMLPEDQCRNLDGEPKGPGSFCLGDADGNNIDDICEPKWIQFPDLEETGMDVDATEPLILADDFLCTQRTRITDIRIWGSWRYDELPGQPGDVEFTLSFHKDIPADPAGGLDYSQPGEVLWVKDFPPYSFVVTPFMTGINEGWFDPWEQLYIFPGDHICWEYRFHIPPAEAFCQEGDSEAPVVYWLDVQARNFTGQQVRFGWKTSTTHWNDDATWGVGIEPYLGPWNELRYPPQHPLAGQSIDLAFALGGDEPCEDLDWGDAPDRPYPTLAASGGANHVIVPGGPTLGMLIDAEGDGQPTPPADGDDLGGIDDEDGVVFTSLLVRGKPATVDVFAPVGGILDAWIDFNGNGSWADPGDQIFVSFPLIPGLNSLSFPVPPTAKSGPTYARFRLSSAGGLSFAGPAPDGEVEDYLVRIEPARIVARRLFYNNSWYDGNNPALDAADDAAIDPGKQFLLAGGGASSFASYCAYDKGVNGLMFDVDGASMPPGPADFTFELIGIDGSLEGIGPLVAPGAFAIVPGGGVGGSDRVKVAFAPGTCVKNWMKVTIGTTFDLSAADVSYIGNAVGECNSPSGTNYIVNATDFNDCKNPANAHGPFNPAPVDDWYDINKDRLVNATDLNIIRANFNGPFNCLKQIVR